MDNRNNKSIRIGDVLQELGYIGEEEIEKALAYQKEHKNIRMGGALIALDLITESQMLEALSERMHYPLLSVSEIAVDEKALKLLPAAIAEKYTILPYQVKEDVLFVLVNDPLDYYGIEDSRQIVGMDLRIGLCEKEELVKAIPYYYSKVSAQRAAKKASAGREAEQEILEIRLEDGEDDTPIINLLNSLLIRAYNSNVSDIHIEPFESKTNVRMRLDGVVSDFMTLQKNIHNPLVARIKIISDLDIAEHRVPQDGHFRRMIEGFNLNVRVSIIPTVFGEKVVLRLLSNNAVVDHEELYGMTQEKYEIAKKMLRSPHGIIFITGPTGSGKSTTLYMMLERQAKQNVNISTIEDPVEKNIARLNQMQVNQMAGLTFSTGLRALLRQDPDIIMVGETRDEETAKIAVRAAITGHLVFSTLHTNDAASAVARLKDMGVESYLVAGALVGVIAQRLVRKLCPACSEWGEMDETAEMNLKRKFPKIKKAKGCRMCNFTGYKGRVAIHEMLIVDKKMRQMISQDASIDDIKDYASQELGMETLRESALALLEQGVTSVEEVLKVAYYD